MSGEKSKPSLDHLSLVGDLYERRGWVDKWAEKVGASGTMVHRWWWARLKTLPGYLKEHEHER